MSAEHKVVAMMARSWSERGTSPPYDWWWTCTCGERSKRYLRHQQDAITDWRDHAGVRP